MTNIRKYNAENPNWKKFHRRSEIGQPYSDGVRYLFRMSGKLKLLKEWIQNPSSRDKIELVWNDTFDALIDIIKTTRQGDKT